MRKYSRRIISFCTALLLAVSSACTAHGAPKQETISVRFVTSWNGHKNTGGVFKTKNKKDFKLTGHMKSADYITLSDGDNKEFDCVAAWDVVYKKGAKSVSSFPEIAVNGSDTFLGWLDVDGGFVNEDTAPKDGDVYTAVYKTSDVPAADTPQDAATGGKPVSDEVKTAPKTVAQITYAVDKGKGSFGSLNGMDIPDVNTCVLSQDDQNLTVSYNKNGTFKTLPEVVPAKGYTFKGWKDYDGNVIDKDTKLKDNGVYEAVFEKDGQSGSAGAKNSYSGTYMKSDAGTNPGNMSGTYKAAAKPGWLKKADDAVSDDGTQLYYDADGNIVSYPVGYDEENNVYRYLLHVTGEDGAVKDFGCMGSQTLSEVLSFMGYDVASFGIKQAGADEYAIDGKTGFSSIVDLFKNGDIGILGYGKDNALAVCAVARQTAYDYEYDVWLSKSLDMELKTADEAAAGIKGSYVPDGVSGTAPSSGTVPSAEAGLAGNPGNVSDTEPGKNSQMAVDSIGLEIYLGLGVSVLALILGYLVYVKKIRK